MSAPPALRAIAAGQALMATRVRYRLDVVRVAMKLTDDQHEKAELGALAQRLRVAAGYWEARADATLAGSLRT